MSKELKLLAASCKDRGSYELIKEHTDPDSYTAQGRILFECIEDYYGRDAAAETVDQEILHGYVERKISNVKHRETFRGLVDGIYTLEVSVPNVVGDLLTMKQAVIGNRLAIALSGGDGDVADLMEEYQSCQTTLSTDSSEVFTGVDFLSLAEQSYTPKDLIKIYPPALNQRLGGGCLRGHHIVLFARPEMGKTMFLVNCLSGFLYHGLKVLYVGNEDPLADIASRVLSRLSGTPATELAESSTQAMALATERGAMNLTAVHLEPGTPREIDRLCQAHKPDVLIVDQLRNLKSKEDSLTQSLEHVARDIRGVGQRNNCLVVSVTQAGGSADGKAILDMNDIDSSKTGVRHHGGHGWHGGRRCQQQTDDYIMQEQTNWKPRVLRGICAALIIQGLVGCTDKEYNYYEQPDVVLDDQEKDPEHIDDLCVELSWELPTEREDGSELQPEEITQLYLFGSLEPDYPDWPAIVEEGDGRILYIDLVLISISCEDLPYDAAARYWRAAVLDNQGLYSQLSDWVKYEQDPIVLDGPGSEFVPYWVSVVLGLRDDDAPAR